MVDILSGFLLWVEWFVTTYGLGGSFVVAALESFIFPVPTVVILAPSTAFGVDPLLIAVVATIGSVLGAIVGYFLGYYLGRPVADKLFGKKMNSVEKWFEKYGVWAVLLAAVSPIPFKVFTWAAGILRLRLDLFILASVAGRFVQFLLFAYAGSIFGPWFLQVVGF